MDWKEKAAYLARRAEQKGGVWLIWLGRVEDNPTRLGSTTDEEDLRDPSSTELGWYGPGTTREQILADVAKALGSVPTGEANLSRPGRPPGPKTERSEPQPEVCTNHSVPGPPAEEAEQERPAPNPAGEPEARPAPDSEPPEPEHEDPAVAEQTEPAQAASYSESTVHSVRAKLFSEYTKAHEHGPREARDLWHELIKQLDEVVA